MSFASEVKKELLNIEDLEECCQKAFVCGYLSLSSDIALSSTGMKIIIKSTIGNSIKVIIQLLEKWYKFETTLSYYDEASLGKRRFYKAELKNVETIVQDFHLLPTDELKITDELLKKQCCRKAFLRGCFIAKGSINDPRKNSYHFEISSQSNTYAVLIKKLFNKIELNLNIIERRNQYVIYIKKSEDISSILAYIGADSGVFYFEDQRIVRDVSNMANRMTNCDIYNETKCANTSDLHFEAISYIRGHKEFNSIPVRIQSIILLREQYPDSAYEELSYYSDNIFGKKLSKSGISHCFKSLIEYYEGLKRENQ